jgi:hypothetical protein
LASLEYQYLRVLKEINPHYAHITIDESLEVARAMEIFPHQMTEE